MDTFKNFWKGFFELLVLKDTLVIPKILAKNIFKDVPLEFVVFSFLVFLVFLAPLADKYIVLLYQVHLNMVTARPKYTRS